MRGVVRSLAGDILGPRTLTPLSSNAAAAAARPSANGKRQSHIGRQPQQQPCRGIQYKQPKQKRDSCRPLRSVLFTPGARLDKMRKALTSVPADVLAFDLEDSVAYDRKAEARQLVKQVLEEEEFGKRSIAVRVNSLGSKWWKDDLAEMARQPRVNSIIIPKVNTADTLITASELMARHGAHEGMTIWAMIETPHAVMNIKEISQSANFIPRLEALMMGTSDLTNELHAMHRPDRVPLIYSLSKCVVAARAFKLRVIDGVHLNLNDPEGFAEACAQGRALGFDGKSLIHPKTVAAANQAFGPRIEEVEHARRVLQAWDDAQKQGEGLAVVDGTLIEILHVDEASRILQMQRNIEAVEASLQGMTRHSPTSTTSDTPH